MKLGAFRAVSFPTLGPKSSCIFSAFFCWLHCWDVPLRLPTMRGGLPFPMSVIPLPIPISNCRLQVHKSPHRL